MYDNKLTPSEFFSKLFSFFYLREAFERFVLSSDAQGWATKTSYINIPSSTGVSQDAVQLITIKLVSLIQKS